MIQYPHLKKLILGLLISAVVGFGSSLTAKADLVQLTEVQLTGQGVGAKLTVLTLQSPANTTRESRRRCLERYHRCRVWRFFAT